MLIWRGCLYPNSLDQSVFEAAILRVVVEEAHNIWVLLAAPWGVLGAWLLGQLPQQQELILIALCVGMSASGSVLLSTIYPAAITYMACILAPVAIKCFFLLAGREYLLLGALTLCYAMFLLNCISTCARLFAEKKSAVDELKRKSIGDRTRSIPRRPHRTTKSARFTRSTHRVWRTYVRHCRIAMRAFLHRP